MYLTLENIKRIYPNYSDDDIRKALIIMDFLINHSPNSLSSGKSKSLTLETEEGILAIIKKIIDGRYAQYNIVAPSTYVDPAAVTIMKQGYGYKDDELIEHSLAHQEFMLTENMVGALLEAYIASKLEPYGWIWCSGSIVSATDFIKPVIDPDTNETNYVLIQVKNRNNTENSSSSKIREGTEIIKWWRLHSRTGHTNWDKLNEELKSLDLSDEEVRFSSLSEDGFIQYIRNINFNK